MPASSAYVRPYRSSTTAISFSAIPGSAFWRKEGGAGSSHAPPDGSVVSRSRADVCQHGPGILFDGEVADGDDADRPAVLADRQPPHRMLAHQLDRAVTGSSGATVTMRPLAISPTVVRAGSLPSASARTTMSRSVSMP